MKTSDTHQQSLSLGRLDEGRLARIVCRPPAPRARKSDVSTSHEAASKAVAFVARDIARINAALRDIGPMTAYEIADKISLDHIAVSRRMHEMVKRLLVRDPKKYNYQTRPSPTGRACIVWEART